MFETLDIDARAVLVKAVEVSSRRPGFQRADAWDLLAGLAFTPNAESAILLENFRGILQLVLEKRPTNFEMGERPGEFSQDLRITIEKSVHRGKELGLSRIGSGLILITLLREHRALAAAFAVSGLDADALCQEFETQIHPSHRSDTERPQDAIWKISIGDDSPDAWDGPEL